MNRLAVIKSWYFMLPWALTHRQSAWFVFTGSVNTNLRLTITWDPMEQLSCAGRPYAPLEPQYLSTKGKMGFLEITSSTALTYMDINPYLGALIRMARVKRPSRRTLDHIARLHERDQSGMVLTHSVTAVMATNTTERQAKIFPGMPDHPCFPPQGSQHPVSPHTSVEPSGQPHPPPFAFSPAALPAADGASSSNTTLNWSPPHPSKHIVPCLGLAMQLDTLVKHSLFAADFMRVLQRVKVEGGELVIGAACEEGNLL
ncbi:hypothetical protein DNTS_014454, partial [Danionella cerebrum]